MDQSIGQVELDGLEEVRIETSVPTSRCVLTRCVARQRKDCSVFKVMGAPELLAHPPSIKLSCAKVQKDHVRAKHGCDVKCISTTVNRSDQVSPAFEKTREHCAILRIVVGYQNPPRKPAQVSGLVT
jgi:hypothetical protein